MANQYYIKGQSLRLTIWGRDIIRGSKYSSWGLVYIAYKKNTRNRHQGYHDHVITVKDLTGTDDL